MKNQLLDLLRPHGQEHLLAFWEDLDATQRESLARQIEDIDFDLIRRLHESRDQRTDMGQLAARAEAPPAFRLDTNHNRYTPRQARRRARQALAAGQVGAILVAGGQGTRLGFDHPKGMFPIGPLSDKTLFQIHVEKILAASRRYGVRIPLYLMTSPATHEETVAFFAEHDRFGLPEEDLVIFCQGTMPAVDERTGRVLLETPGQIALSPDGHGGVLAAIVNNGVLDDMQHRDIRQLFYFQVDNPLVDICGQEFLGYHLLAGSEFSTQVIAKHDPLERVGNVVQVDGRLTMIEYSDLPDEAAMRRNADGSLAIWAGSIAVHVIDTDLLQRLSHTAEGLPFHIARKKVPYLDASGRRIEPSEPNAVKFERFVFDLMPEALEAVIVEVDRAQAFAPVKNATGAQSDTPELARAQMAALHRDWLRQAGAEIDDAVTVEISPLHAQDVEELAAKTPPGTRVDSPTYFA
ncbi:MAG: UDPGP type 1 family protein [Pirellulales bacterium]|nr:UDPGP type 1 family protein [Pirellulales bacterium]